MATALDIITQSLQKLGVYAPGETLSSADSGLGLAVLNDMLDSWSTESLSCYAILEQSVVLTPGVNQYSIGPGGAINGTRPTRLIIGPGAAYIQDPSLNNYPVNVVARDYWNLIGTRNVNSNVPDTLFYDPQEPLGFINLFPTPNIGWTLYFDSYLQITQFATLYSTFSMPPGYLKAIKDCLAPELWPYFKNGEVTMTLQRQAMVAKGNIKRSNVRENVALYDPEIIARAQGSYNIYSDRNG
jgi:hypothetical protein